MNYYLTLRAAPFQKQFSSYTQLSYTKYTKIALEVIGQSQMSSKFNNHFHGLPLGIFR